MSRFNFRIGKTILAAAIIEHLAEKEVVLFTFANFRNARTTTAIGVLHSIIFQIALMHPLHRDLKPIVSESYDTNPRFFQGRSAYLGQLLQELLQQVKNPYIVLDGIDEMELIERQQLLKTMMNLHNQHVTLEMLLSSRDEPDISKALGAKAISLRVDQVNSGEIEAYVSQRVETWASGRDLDDCTLQTVKSLLHPVALKAKGSRRLCI